MTTQIPRELIFLMVFFALAPLAGCHGAEQPDGEEGPGNNNLIVVNAPAAGVVRRILVNEGGTVDRDGGMIEIAVPMADLAPAPTEDPLERARAADRSAQQELAAARREVERTAIEVQRVEPLVTAGVAPQAQLDAARAQSQRAQEQLQQARQRQQTAQTNVLVQEGALPAANLPPAEKLVTVRATTAGTVRVLSVQVGQHVTAGQALATIAASK